MPRLKAASIKIYPMFAWTLQTTGKTYYRWLESVQKSAITKQALVLLCAESNANCSITLAKQG